jgi:hypothetical protein
MRVGRVMTAGFFLFFLAVFTVLAPPGGAERAKAADGLPTTWYFAEGTTREGFVEYLSLQNPSGLTAQVYITYQTNLGEEGPYYVAIPPVSRGTVLVNSYLEEGLDVSVKIVCEQGLVAERPMYFVYKGKWPGGHVVMGVTETSTTWYFAEGTTREGFEEWLCLQNPQPLDVVAHVTYIFPDGAELVDYVIPGGRRYTVDVNAEVARLVPEEPHQDVSIKIQATGGIIAERPMYFSYKGSWEGGHDVVGEAAPAKKWYLAEGYCQWNFETWLCFMNPGIETAHVVIRYRRGDGASLPPQGLEIPGYSRRTVYVNQVAGFGEFSFEIESDRDIVVERPMYFYYRYSWEGGHDNFAQREGVPELYLAEGATWHGIETYLCVLNPLDEQQTVIVEYLMEEGGYGQVEFVVPPHSRYTRNVNADVGENHDVSFRVTAFRGEGSVEPGEIVVERPMYFLYGGTMPGGHVASGFPGTV